MAKKQVVIIGGSIGGITALASLLKQFKPDDIYVTIVEKNPDFYYFPATQRALVDPEFAKKIVYSYEKLFKSAEQGQLITASVISFDETKVCLSNGATLNYDFMILASGTTFAAGKSAFKTRYLYLF
jgi:NADH dehydrogenase FAD-containing subunit